jgi:aryl-phospho-beta-D-glucosidase BglC (GH1 family)
MRYFPACGRVVAGLLGLVLGACADQESPAASRADAATPALPALVVQDGTLRDALGRQVILRGINHIGLRSNGRRPAYRVDGAVTPPEQLFDLQDLDDEDFARIAALGFNFVRPVFTWEFAQPDPPPAPYNEAYFRLVDAFLDRAAAHGLYVVFNFGQFGWSRAAGGNAGAPEWALSDMCRSFPGRRGNEPPQATARVGCAFMDFWANEVIAGIGVQDAYIELWRTVMRRYRDHPAVVMVDLFNEPYGGLYPPVVLETQYLYPFYRRLAQAIREIDPEIVIGFQPQLYHSLGIPTPAPEAIGIDNAVFLPHEYTAAYFAQRADPSYPPGQDALTRADFALTAEDARTLGTPWSIGETGWTRTTGADGVEGPVPSSDPAAPPAYARDLVRLANELHLGWTWFAYSSVDEAYGILPAGAADEPLLRELATPFPRAVGGSVASIAFDPATRQFALTVGAASPLPAQIALPLSWQYPDGACVRIDGTAAARIAADGALEVLAPFAMRFDAARAVLEFPGTPQSLVTEPLTAACG